MIYKAVKESDEFYYVKDDIHSNLCRCKTMDDAEYIARRLNKLHAIEAKFDSFLGKFNIDEYFEVIQGE